MGEVSTGSTSGKEILYCATVGDWHEWLASHAGASDGIRLAIAKKGGASASVSYAEALDEALCVGWIDGQKFALDSDHFLQGFGPRRARSIWSVINRDKALALVASGRMQPAGLAEIERAQADGRWDAAYAGSRTITVPAELAAALAAAPAAAAFFETLSSQNRYAILFRLGNLKTEAAVARNVEKFIGMLERGETVYPQKNR